MLDRLRRATRSRDYYKIITTKFIPVAIRVVPVCTQEGLIPARGAGPASARHHGCRRSHRPKSLPREASLRGPGPSPAAHPALGFAGGPARHPLKHLGAPRGPAAGTVPPRRPPPVGAPRASAHGTHAVAPSPSPRLPPSARARGAPAPPRHPRPAPPPARGHPPAPPLLSPPARVTQSLRLAVTHCSAVGGKKPGGGGVN